MGGGRGGVQPIEKADVARGGENTAFRDRTIAVPTVTTFVSEQSVSSCERWQGANTGEAVAPGVFLGVSPGVRVSCPAARVCGSGAALAAPLLRGSARSKEGEAVCQPPLEQVVGKGNPNSTNTLKGKLSPSTVRLVSATGVRKVRPFFQPLRDELKKLRVVCQFLYLPNSPKKDLWKFWKKKKKPHSLRWFAELNSKNTVSYILVNKEGLFAIMWKNPETQKRGQLLETVSPESLMNNPTNWQPKETASRSCLAVSWFCEHRQQVPHAMLLEQSNAILKTFIANPGMSLYSVLTDNVFECGCLQTVEEAYSSKPALKEDIPQGDSDWDPQADKNSFMASYAVTTTNQKLQNYIVLSRPTGLDTLRHPFQPENQIYVKGGETDDSDPSQTKWRRPSRVLLTKLQSNLLAEDPTFSTHELRRLLLLRQLKIKD